MELGRARGSARSKDRWLAPSELGLQEFQQRADAGKRALFAGRGTLDGCHPGGLLIVLHLPEAKQIRGIAGRGLHVRRTPFSMAKYTGQVSQNHHKLKKDLEEDVAEW